MRPRIYTNLLVVVFVLFVFIRVPAGQTYTNPIIRADYFARPQHGNGVWAPAIRFHNGEFHIFYGDPDFGIYMLKARNAAGPWSKPGDWPVIGNDADGDGKGEPVASYRKPNVGGMYPVQSPQTSDEFNEGKLGLQWQWHANPLESWFSFSERRGQLSLTAVPQPAEAKNLWGVPNLLLQKLPSENFTITTLVDISHLRARERSGLLMMGREYSYLAVVKTENGARVVHVVCRDALNGTAETESSAVHLRSRMVYLRINCVSSAGDVICNFSFSPNGTTFRWMSDIFVVQPGLWIGAKVGLFALGPRQGTTSGAGAGHADYDWFRLLPPARSSRTRARAQ